MDSERLMNEKMLAFIVNDGSALRSSVRTRHSVVGRNFFLQEKQVYDGRLGGQPGAWAEGKNVSRLGGSSEIFQVKAS